MLATYGSTHLVYNNKIRMRNFILHSLLWLRLSSLDFVSHTKHSSDEPILHLAWPFRLQALNPAHFGEAGKWQ